MTMFATELQGKTIMTQDGQILGILADYIVDTRTGKIKSMLVTPAENVETRLFKTDPSGRLVIAFHGMRAVKDVVVVELKE